MSGRPQGYIPVCLDCSVVLTAENRYGNRSRCLEHGREHERKRQESRRSTRARRTERDRTHREEKRSTAERGAAARAAPGWNDAKERELHSLLQRVIPPVFKFIGLYRDRDHELTVRLRKAMQADEEEQQAAWSPDQEQEMRRLLVQAIDEAGIDDHAIEHVPRGSLDLGLSTHEFPGPCERAGRLIHQPTNQPPTRSRQRERPSP